MTPEAISGLHRNKYANGKSSGTGTMLPALQWEALRMKYVTKSERTSTFETYLQCFEYKFDPFSLAIFILEGGKDIPLKIMTGV